MQIMGKEFDTPKDEHLRTEQALIAFMIMMNMDIEQYRLNEVYMALPDDEGALQWQKDLRSAIYNYLSNI